MKKRVRKSSKVKDKKDFLYYALKIGFYIMVIGVPLFIFPIFMTVSIVFQDNIGGYIFTYFLLVVVSVFSLVLSIIGLKKGNKKLSKKVLITSIVALVILFLIG